MANEVSHGTKKNPSDFYYMRTFLNFLVPWDTLGVPRGPPGQGAGSQICSWAFSGDHYGVVACHGSPDHTCPKANYAKIFGLPPPTP